MGITEMGIFLGSSQKTIIIFEFIYVSFSKTSFIFGK